jgi:hypothetical protein
MSWLMVEHMKPPMDSDPMWIEIDTVVFGPSYANWSRYLEQVGWSGNIAINLKKRLDIIREA